MHSAMILGVDMGGIMVRCFCVALGLVWSSLGLASDREGMVSSETEGPELDWEEMTFIPWKGRTPGVQGVVNGTKATSGQFHCRQSRWCGGRIFYGVLLGDRHLETVGYSRRHCLDDVDDLQSQGYNLRVFFGHDIINVGPEAQIQWESYVSHPYWSGEIECGADIGLVKMVT